MGVAPQDEEKKQKSICASACENGEPPSLGNLLSINFNMLMSSCYHVITIMPTILWSKQLREARPRHFISGFGKNRVLKKTITFVTILLHMSKNKQTKNKKNKKWKIKNNSRWGPLPEELSKQKWIWGSVFERGRSARIFSGGPFAPVERKYFEPSYGRLSEWGKK